MSEVCDRISRLLDAHIDGELNPEEGRDVDAHLGECVRCRNILKEITHYKEVIGSMKLKEPSPEELENQVTEVRGRIQRGIGWVFTAVGLVILLVYGIFEYFREPGIVFIEKFAVAAFIIGIFVLFTRVLHDRMIDSRTDRYKEVEK